IRARLTNNVSSVQSGISSGCRSSRLTQKKSSAPLVDSAEPFRISTSHSADRDERKLGGAGDLRSFQFDWAPARGAAVEKTRRMGARAARAASARDENSLWRWRGDLRRNSENQGFHGRAGGRRHGD